MTYILGIDGGGSKTTCLVADESGRILGQGLGGPANYLKEGLYVVKRSLRQAINGALLESALAAKDIEILCAGLAGADRPRGRQVMEQLFREILPQAEVMLETDAMIALVGATEGKHGVIVISGTGSVALGVNQRGEIARSGGWGHLLGDEGSGYDIARRGLMAALHQLDGRGPETHIARKLYQELYLHGPDDLIHLLYSSDMTPGKIATLYPVVLESAQEGDELARRLLSDAAKDLAKMALAVIAKLGLNDDRFYLTVSGGVFENSEQIKSEFETLTRRKARQLKFVTPKHRPAFGALLLAQGRFRERESFDLPNEKN